MGLDRLLAAAAAASLVIACSASSEPCDARACVAHDVCLRGFDDYDAQIAKNPATTRCRLPCTAPEECPFNYHCFDPSDGTTAYCVADRRALAPGPGQWGAPCDPGSIPTLPSCDTAQGFACYGASPEDGNAFCTRLACADDGDCTGGYWCAQVNASQANAGTGVLQVCLPRVWDLRLSTRCSPCTSDVDCPASDGAKQHCVESADLTKQPRSLCARECSSDWDCTLDAHCDKDGVCVPNEGSCVGNGALCSPCRSDVDCVSGRCIRADLSNELFCTQRSSGPGCPPEYICPDLLGVGIDVTPTCAALSSTYFECESRQKLPSGTFVLGCWTRGR